MNKREKRPLTPDEEMLKAYNTKLKREAIFKSLMLALACGFLLSVIVSIISFATQYNALWIALGVWAAATLGLTFLFYYTVFRVNLKTTAERVDGIGLEERVITMVQFKDSENPMIKRQREDAQTVLSSVTTKHMKMRIPRVLIIVLAAIALVAVVMMWTSTALAVKAEEQAKNPPIVEEELSEEDKIIREMLEKLRDEINAAKVDETFRGYLHSLVDDLEASLKPEYPLSVKVARIMDTAEKIHKLIEDYLNRSTIAEELMKHDTTFDLGKAIDSRSTEKMREAFQKMYDSIAPLVEQEKFDLIQQTADDLTQSLEDAVNTPPALQKALEDLRDAFLRALEPPEDGDEKHKSDEDINKELQDAFENAMDALEDYFEEQQAEDKGLEDLDQALEDVFKDAMEQLGQEFEYPKDPEEQEEEEKKEEEEGQLPEEDEKKEEGNESAGSDDGGNVDSVIDGNTSYKDVFDDGYSDDIQDKLESGELNDEDQETIGDYFDMLK